MDIEHARKVTLDLVAQSLQDFAERREGKPASFTLVIHSESPGADKRRIEYITTCEPQRLERDLRDLIGIITHQAHKETVLVV